MARNPKHAESEKLNPHELWKEISLTRAQVEELAEQGKINRDLGPATRVLEELKLKTANYEKLLEELQGPVRAVLGKNFLGIEEWRNGFGVHVGATPPIPELITAELLNSDSPLHPGEKIKDTHLLILMPAKVNDLPYSASKLSELCASRKGSGKSLMSGVWNLWKSATWGNVSPSESEWVLIPKSDPDPQRVPWGHYFRFRDYFGQVEVYKHYKEEYRYANALEVMTAALLNDVVNGERILSDYYLRAKEPGTLGHVIVGLFDAHGLRGLADLGHGGEAGVALARKL